MNKKEYVKAKKKLGFDPLTDKPGRALFKSEFELCFLILKWKHGDKAKSCRWVSDNGYRWFVTQVYGQFNKWTNFISILGEILVRRECKSPKELLQYWKEKFYAEHGDKAKSCGWLDDNGDRWFVMQVYKRFGNWTNFIKELGEEPIHRKSKSQKELLQYWKDKLHTKHGDKAKNSTWMQDNGCGWFVGQVRKRFGNWGNFIKATKGHFEIPIEKMEIY